MLIIYILTFIYHIHNQITKYNNIRKCISIIYEYFEGHLLSTIICRRRPLSLAIPFRELEERKVENKMSEYCFLIRPKGRWSLSLPCLVIIQNVPPS